MSSSLLRARSSAAASTSYRPAAPSHPAQRARVCGRQQQAAAAAAAAPPRCVAAAERRRPALGRQAPRPCSVRAAASSSPKNSPDASAAPPAAPAPVVAVEGDIVRVHWSCRDAQSGAVLECSRGGGAIVASAPRLDKPFSAAAADNGEDDSNDDDGEREPLTFEVGAGDTQNNPIFEAFDDAVRGLPVGGRAEIEAKGGVWDPARLFTVPRAHDEVQRLEGRYKSHGGLREGMVVELANGAAALVVSCDDGSVRLDANSMLAGKEVVFELELVGLEREQ